MNEDLSDVQRSQLCSDAFSSQPRLEAMFVNGEGEQEGVEMFENTKCLRDSSVMDEWQRELELIDLRSTESLE